MNSALEGLGFVPLVAVPTYLSAGTSVTLPVVVPRALESPYYLYVSPFEDMLVRQFTMKGHSLLNAPMLSEQLVRNRETFERYGFAGPRLAEKDEVVFEIENLTACGRMVHMCLWARPTLEGPPCSVCGRRFNPWGCCTVPASPEPVKSCGNRFDGVATIGCEGAGFEVRAPSRYPNRPAHISDAQFRREHEDYCRTIDRAREKTSSRPEDPDRSDAAWESPNDEWP